jgi:exocyst complex component 8
LTVDVKALRDPSLRAEQYIAGLLTDASEQEIDEYQQALQKLRNRASTDLQQNVYQNRTQFIKISKEAEKLKGEMRALRNLMSELKTNTTALRTASSQGPSGTNEFESGFPSTLSKRDKRSSVADRTAMWNSQLQVSILFEHAFGTLLILAGIMENRRGLAEVSTSLTWPSRSSKCWTVG